MITDQLLLNPFFDKTNNEGSGDFQSLKMDRIRSMCLELQFSRPRWRWVSAATIASDRYV